MGCEQLQEDEDGEDGDDGEEEEVVDDGLGESECVLGGHTYMTSPLRRNDVVVQYVMVLLIGCVNGTMGSKNMKIMWTSFKCGPLQQQVLLLYFP